MTHDLPAARPRPRRHGAGWTMLASIVAVLVAIAVVGDRVAAKYATDELRAQLVSEMSDRGVDYGSAEVTIGGFPFLTQVARGRYDEITIAMSDVRLDASDGRIVTLPRLDVVASGVDAATAEVVRGTAQVVADQVTGEAMVSFGTLQTLVDYSRYRLSEVKFSESGGDVQITANANVAGTQVPISATAEVTVREGTLAVKLRDARAVGLEAPGPVRDYLTDLVQSSLAARLPQLPFGLTLDNVSVAAEGLAISAIGHDVPLVS